MYVIAKQQVRSVEDYGTSRKITFGCVYDNSINKGEGDEENRAFTKATPSGESWMTVDNKFVWSAFRPPVEFDEAGYRAAQHYVVYIPCAEHTLEDVQRALAALSA